MPQQAPCAGQCGRPIYLSNGSLPAGEATCRACRAAGRGPRSLVALTCGHCGIEFARKAGATRPDARPFCSVACCDLGKRTRYRTCEVCDTPYVASYTEQRTCSRACGKQIRRPRERQTGPSCRIFAGYCQQCGGAFTARQKRATCSPPCANRLYNAQARPAPVEHQCRDCGGAISNRRSKCDPCLAKRRAMRKRQDKRRRRALKLGVPSEPYTLKEIAARDRFRCGLCQKRVDMRCYFPHPEAPTIDHVVPLARGGDDMRANVQLAHFLCNSRKSDRGGGEQLALVG